VTTVGVRRLGHVSSEGGPLLLLDVSILPSWGGADVGDYHRICDWLDRHPDQPGYAAEVGPSEGLVVTLPAGTYTAWHDDVDTASVRARRCWLVPEGEQPA
jgi:hypothetical protein